MGIRIFSPSNKPVPTPSLNQKTYTQLLVLVHQQTHPQFHRTKDIIRIRLRSRQTLEDVLSLCQAGHNPLSTTPQLRIVSNGDVVTSSFSDRLLDELFDELWRVGEGVPDSGTKVVALAPGRSLEGLVAALKQRPTAADPLERLRGGGAGGVGGGAGKGGATAVLRRAGRR